MIDRTRTTLRAAETIVAWAALIALMATCLAFSLLVFVGAYTTIRWIT